MKTKLFISFVVAGFFVGGCNSKNGNHSDRNPEASKNAGDTIRRNSETNEEADRRASLVSVSSETGDKGFVKDASDAGKTEVKLGELASSKGGTPKIREFGKMMVKDHTAANSELRSLATKKSINIPDSVCGKCKEKIDDLTRLKGNEFDKRYAEMMVADHEEVIRKFEAQSARGSDDNLKSWAAGKLPTLRHHLEEARNLLK